MRVALSRVGEVVLNKANNKKYIVTDVRNYDGKISADIELYKEDEDEELDLSVMQSSTITEENERLYRHKFNTVELAAFKSYDVAPGTFSVDEKEIKTGDIEVVKFLGTGKNYIVFEGKRDEQTAVYSYDVKNDRFDALFEASSVNVKTYGDDLVLTYKRSEPIIDEDTEEETGRLYFEDMVIVADRKAPVIFKATMSLNENVEIANVKIRQVGDFNIFSIEKDKAAFIVLHNSGNLIIAKDNASFVPTYVGYRNGYYLLGENAYMDISSDTLIEDKELSVLTTEGCNLLFERGSDGYGCSQLSFTNSAMNMVITVEIVDTNDRGRVVTVA